MDRGTVKWFDEIKGFGFITPDTGNKDLFVHRTKVETQSGLLEKGERVEYELGEGPKGPQAEHVRLLLEES